MVQFSETRLRDLPTSTPLTLGLWTTAAKAAGVLDDAGAVAALVLDAGRPLGVVTARGLARLLLLDPDKAAHLAVGDVMDPVAVSQQSDFLPAALRHLLAAPSRRLAVVDATGRAVGILAPLDMARLGQRFDAVAGRTVASAMTRTVVTASGGEPLPLVLGRMLRAGVGGVVVAEDDRSCGRFTAREAMALLAAGRDIRHCPVAEVMRAPVEAISPQLSLAEAVDAMEGDGAGRLAVTDAAGSLLGVLTATDVAAAFSRLLAEAQADRMREEAARRRDHGEHVGHGFLTVAQGPEPYGDTCLPQARAILDALPLPAFYKSRDGSYTGCNPAFETLLGLSRADLIGKTLGDLCGREKAGPYLDLDDALLAKGSRQVYEAVLPTAAGLRQMAIHKAVIRDDAGEAIGIIGVAIDVTERKLAEAAATKVRDGLEAETVRLAGELRQARQRLALETAERERVEKRLRDEARFLEAILSTIQDGICVLGTDLTVAVVNQAMRTIAGDCGELVGRKCHEVFRGMERPCQDCPALRSMATGKLAMTMVERSGFRGQTGWLELFCFPLVDEAGAVTGAVEIARDVTAGKKLQAELAAALERAEAGSLAKGAFLANMSHEIRTPLNAVLGYVQLMLRDRLEPRQRERLTVVGESAETLLSLINDILDYSKIEAGRLELKEEVFDLPRCLAAVVKEQEILAGNKGLTLALDIAPDVPRSVWGDGQRLRQVLRNLVNNAVKYTDVGGVTLGVSRTGELAGSVGDGPRLILRFAVADTGIGIPEDQQAAIFDSFTQVDDGLTKRQAGTGLGLAICRRLAGLMGGGVFLKSEPGRGSVFWLECPFEVAAPASETCFGKEAGVTAGAVPRLRILLVEDNRVNSIFAVDLLESWGHEVVLAENGQAALDRLAGERVDLVLMDIQMPVMDGLAATRAIRSGLRGIDPSLPVIGLSAYAMDQERERFLAAGLDDYITKPIAMGAFFEVLRTVLTRRGRWSAPGGEVAVPRQEAILDAQGLFAQYGCKAGLLARVGREFVNTVPEQLEVLDAAMREGDLVLCERVAHTLKGNAAMFGAVAMRSLAAQAEVAAASGDADLVERLVPTLSDACRTAVDSMDDFLNRLEA